MLLAKLLVKYHILLFQLSQINWSLNSSVPISAVRIGKVRHQFCDVNDCACGLTSCNCDDCTHSVRNFTDNLTWTSSAVFKAKSASALSCIWRTVSPADWTNTVGSVLTLRITKSRIIVFIGWALHRITCSATVRVFVAWYTDVRHSILAVWWTDATARVMITIATDWVPQETILLAVVALLGWSGATAVRWGLSAVSTVISEVWRAVLPTNGSNAVVSVSTKRIAKPAVLLLVWGTSMNGWPNSTTVGEFPTSGIFIAYLVVKRGDLEEISIKDLFSRYKACNQSSSKRLHLLLHREEITKLLDWGFGVLGFWGFGV